MADRPTLVQILAALVALDPETRLDTLAMVFDAYVKAPEFHA